MIIRIESSVTLQVAERHYVKEARTLEMEHDDILSLLCTDPELQDRYADLKPDELLSMEAIQDAFDSAFYAIKGGLWDSIADQLEEMP